MTRAHVPIRPGDTFGFLVAKAEAPPLFYGARKVTRWACICICGAETIKRAQILKRGAARSCGCKHSELQTAATRGRQLRPPEPVEVRFARSYRVDPESGCWLWTSHVLRTGYGTFMMHGRVEMAHRASHKLHLGPIPDGLLVCHRCDVRRCVNPDHLFLGTASDNMVDMVRKGRNHVQRFFGEAHPGSKLTESDVMRMRELRLKERVTCSTLAQMFGVHPGTVRKILARQSWPHV